MRRVSAAGRSNLISWLKLTILFGLLWSISNVATEPRFMALVTAQEETNPTLEPVVAEPGPVAAPSSASETTTGASKEGRTFLTTIRDGGYIGVIIILLSIVAVGFIIEHSITIRKQRLMPDALLDQLEELIAAGDIEGAADYCAGPEELFAWRPT